MPFKIQIVGNVVHAILCYVFIVNQKMGIQGAGMATSIANFAIFVGMVVYTAMIKQIQEAVFLPDKRSFEGLSAYLELAVPAAFMLCFDFWAFDLMTVMAGLIDKES